MASRSLVAASRTASAAFRPQPSDFPLQAATDPATFGAVLAGWVAREETWRTPRTRLDRAWSHGRGYDVDRLANDSQWKVWWPSISDRRAWLHRLANLVPLNKKKNSAAQNYDFREKCDVYFAGTKYVCYYALTSQVLKAKKWTPKVVEARQEELLGVLHKGWAIEKI